MTSHAYTTSVFLSNDFMHNVARIKEKHGSSSEANETGCELRAFYAQHYCAVFLNRLKMALLAQLLSSNEEK